MANTESESAPAWGDAGASTDIPSIVAAAVMGLPFTHGGDDDEHDRRHGQIQDAVLQALAAAGVSARGFPLTLTPELLHVLGMPNFQTGPMAHAFRDAGRARIRSKCEDEQAFILHWLMTLVLEHGADWRRHAGETLTPVIAEAKAAREAKEAERVAREAARAGRD